MSRASAAAAVTAWLGGLALAACASSGSGKNPIHAGDTSPLPPPERAPERPAGSAAGCPFDTGLIQDDGIVLVLGGQEQKHDFDDALDAIGSLPAACDRGALILWWELPANDRDRERLQQRVMWLDEEVRRRFDDPVGFNYFAAHEGPPLLDLDPAAPAASRYRLARVPIPTTEVVMQCRGGVRGLTPAELERRRRDDLERERREAATPPLTGPTVRYRHQQGRLTILVPKPSRQPEQVDPACRASWRYRPGLVLVPRTRLPIQVAQDPARQMDPVAPPRRSPRSGAAPRQPESMTQEPSDLEQREPDR